MSLLFHKNIDKTCLLGLTVLFAGTYVFAAEKTIEPSFSLNTIYNDNIGMQGAGSDEIYGLAATVSGNFNYRTETKNAGLLLRNKSSYHNRHDFDSNDQVVNMNFSSLAEKSQFSVGFQYDRNTSRTSEVENTGKIGNVRRESFSLNPRYRFNLTERLYVDNKLSAGFVEYDQNSSGLVGYLDGSFSTTFVYVYSDVLRLSVAPSMGRYISDDQFSSAIDLTSFSPALLKYKNTSDSLGLNFGADYQHNERFSSSIQLGRVQRDARYDLASDTKNLCDSRIILLRGSVVRHPICVNEERESAITSFNYSSQLKLERSVFNVGASVRFLPNSTGNFSRSDRFDLGYNHRIAENLYFNSNLAVSEREIFFTENNVNKKGALRFYNLIIGCNYKITEHLNATANLNHYVTDDSRERSSRSRNQINFGLNYKPTKIFW